MEQFSGGITTVLYSMSDEIGIEMPNLGLCAKQNFEILFGIMLWLCGLRD